MKEFFHNAIDFANWAARHNSKRAKAEGGRDQNILFYKFFLDDGGVPVFRYKYHESESDALFLPETVHIKVF